MSTTLRKTGTFAAFTWTGKLTDPRDPEFAGQLSDQRFRHIDLAASEEVSAGWVTANDPTGAASTSRTSTPAPRRGCASGSTPRSCRPSA